jgi:hypothetical protein
VSPSVEVPALPSGRWTPIAVHGDRQTPDLATAGDWRLVVKIPTRRRERHASNVPSVMRNASSSLTAVSTTASNYAVTSHPPLTIAQTVPLRFAFGTSPRHQCDPLIGSDALSVQYLVL